MADDLKTRLEALADEPYRKFTQALIPDGKPLLGVRMGNLRALAKELANGGWDPLESIEDDTYHEQTMVRALAIAYAPSSELERVARIEAVLPFIDNWAICDSTCATFKHVHSHERLYMRLIAGHLEDPHPYAARFSVVMLLNHFIDEQHLDQLCEMLVLADREHYYIRMAIAWAAATAFSNYPERIKAWLSTFPLASETMRMSFRKITESRKVTKEHKEWASNLAGQMRKR